MTEEPTTPRPASDQLQVGTGLRVEWQGTWWTASVRQVDEHKGVKIGFDTHASSSDEWLPKDSHRIRLADPEDLAAAAREPAAGYMGKPLPDFPTEAPSNFRNRPFVAKPYNPEKEFLKRQLRLREKIAMMQKAKLGAVDPDLEKHIKLAQASAELTEAPVPLATSAFQMATSRLPAPPVAAPIPAPPVAAANPPSAAAPVAWPAAPVVPPAPIPAAPVATSSPPSTAAPVAWPAAPVVPAAPVPAQEAFDAGVGAAPIPGPPLLHPQPSTAGIDAAEVPATPIPAAESSPHSPAAPAADAAPAPQPAATGPPPHVAPQAAAAEPTTAAPPRAVVRWEEVLNAQKERYYHEVATGKTQWELPESGWVELLADDGAAYYWEPESDTTQWYRPGDASPE